MLRRVMDSAASIDKC